MDRVLSTRIDESTVTLLGSLARELGVPKKRVIEQALRAFARTIADEKQVDVFAETCGVWRRDESPGATVKQTREAFRRGLARHHESVH